MGFAVGFCVYTAQTKVTQGQRHNNNQFKNVMQNSCNQMEKITSTSNMQTYTGACEAYSKGQGTPVAQALHPAGVGKEVYNSTSENILQSVLSSVVVSNPQTLVKQG